MSIPNPVFNSPVVGNVVLTFEVTDSHGCIATDDLLVHVTSIVPEPQMANQLICGDGVVQMLATIGPEGDEVQFSLDGISPVYTDASFPYQYTTPLIAAGTDLLVYARTRNSINGFVSSWISATASALSGSIPGYIIGGGFPSCLGLSTGPLQLIEHKGNILRWQKRLNGGNWINIAFTDDLYEETPVAAGFWEYRAVVKLSVCTEVYTDPVGITFSSPTNPGVLTSTNTSICSGSSTGTLTVSGIIGSVIYWERSYNTGPWVIVANGGNTFTDFPVQAGSWNYRVLVANGECAGAYSNPVSIGVAASPAGGSLSGGGQICYGNYTPMMVLSGYTGPVLNWQRRYNGGLWENIVNTGTWYEEIPSASGTWNYRVVIEGYNCPDAYSGIVTVQVLSQSSGGNVNGSTSICLGSSTGYLTLGSYNGTILKWQKKYNTGNWTDINHFTATYQEVPSSPGTWYYRALVQNGTCGQFYATPASVIVSVPAIGGTLTGNTQLCLGSSTGPLTLSGHTGSILKWQRRLNSGNWIDINNQLSTYTETLNQAGLYEYRVVLQNGGCAQVYSSIAAITVNTLTVAGITTGAGSVCFGEAINPILASGYTGVIQGWQKRLNGGSWVDIQHFSNTYQETPVSAGTWDYRAVIQNASCNIATSSFSTVVVNQLPVIYSISGNPILCTGSAGSILNLSGSQTSVGYQLYKNGIVSGFPKQGNGQPLQWSGLQPGLYTVTASGTSTSCGSIMQGELLVTAYPVPVTYPVSSAGYDCGGLGVGEVVLSGSESGISYQLQNNGLAVGLPIVGSGTELNWSAVYAGNYQILGTNQLTGCQSTMSGTAVVEWKPLPQLYAMTGGGSACQSMAGVPVGLSGSQSGINYALFYNGQYNGMNLPGTGQVLNFGNQQSGGVYTIIASNPVTLCQNNMVGSVEVDILPAPILDLGPDILLLYGTSVILSPQIGGGLSPYSYSWTPGTALSNQSASNPIVNPIDTITYTLVLTGNNMCSSTDKVKVIPFLPAGQSVVNGHVVYGNPASTPLVNIPVFIKDTDGNIVAQCFTDANGDYRFQPFPNGQYTLSASSEQAVGGINSTDALRILRHFVQLQTIGGIWLKAGDVDATHYVNSVDALSIQMYFIGAISYFIAGDWIFEEKSLLFDGGIFNKNLTGLCYGDVNGSFIPYAKNGADLNIVKGASMEIVAGQEVLIPVYMDKDAAIGAVSLSFRYDPNAMEIMDAILPEKTGNLFVNALDGLFQLSYVAQDVMIYNTENPVIWLKAKIRDVSSAMYVTGEFADPDAEVYESISLILPDLKLKQTTHSDYMTVYPNPAKDKTKFGFYLETESELSLQLFDTQGRMIKMILNGHYPSGNASLNADLSELPAGFYFGKLYVNKVLSQTVKLEIIP